MPKERRSVKEREEGWNKRNNNTDALADQPD